MTRRRPVLGVISGLVFGVFLAADLILFGVVPTDSILITIVPIVGLALGIFLGVRPVRQGQAAHKDVVPPEAAAQAVAGDAPVAVTPEPPPPPPPPPPS